MKDPPPPRHGCINWEFNNYNYITLALIILTLLFEFSVPIDIANCYWELKVYFVNENMVSFKNDLAVVAKSISML